MTKEARNPTNHTTSGLFSRRVGSPSVALTSLHPVPLPPVGDRPAARRKERETCRERDRSLPSLVPKVPSLVHRILSSYLMVIVFHSSITTSRSGSDQREE